jgi:hypothetical protein
MNFKNITTAILLFGLTFFFADYSFAKTHHKKNAVHKVKSHKKSKKNSASNNSHKKKSAAFGKSKSKKSALQPKKHKRATASTNEDNWAHTGVTKNRKVGSKYNN